MVGHPGLLGGGQHLGEGHRHRVPALAPGGAQHGAERRGVERAAQVQEAGLGLGGELHVHLLGQAQLAPPPPDGEEPLAFAGDVGQAGPAQRGPPGLPGHHQPVQGDPGRVRGGGDQLEPVDGVHGERAGEDLVEGPRPTVGADRDQLPVTVGDGQVHGGQHPVRVGPGGRGEGQLPVGGADQALRDPAGPARPLVRHQQPDPAATQVLVEGGAQPLHVRVGRGEHLAVERRPGGVQLAEDHGVLAPGQRLGVPRTDLQVGAVQPGVRPGGRRGGEDLGDPVGEPGHPDVEPAGAGRQRVQPEQPGPATGELGGHRVDRAVPAAPEQPLGEEPQVGQGHLTAARVGAQLVVELAERVGVRPPQRLDQPPGRLEQHGHRRGDLPQQRAADHDVEVPAGVLVAEGAAGVHLPVPAAGRLPGQLGEEGVQPGQRVPEPVRVAGRGGHRLPGGAQPVQAGAGPGTHRLVADRVDPRAEHPFRRRADRQQRVPGDQFPVDEALQQGVAVVGAAQPEVGVGDHVRGGTTTVAGGQQRRLHGGEFQRRAARPTHRPTVQAEVGGAHRRPPAAYGRVPAERVGVRGHRPGLEGHPAAAGQPLTRSRGQRRRGVRVDGHPAARPEEPDRLVLAAVALPVAQQRLLPVAAAHVAGGVRPGRDQPVERGEDVRVLPGDRLAQQRVGGDPPQRLATVAQRLGERGVERVGGTAVEQLVGGGGGLRGGERGQPVGREPGGPQQRVPPDRPVRVAQRHPVPARPGRDARTRRCHRGGGLRRRGSRRVPQVGPDHCQHVGEPVMQEEVPAVDVVQDEAGGGVPLPRRALRPGHRQVGTAAERHDRHRQRLLGGVPVGVHPAEVGPQQRQQQLDQLRVFEDLLGQTAAGAEPGQQFLVVDAGEPVEVAGVGDVRGAGAPDVEPDRQRPAGAAQLPHHVEAEPAAHRVAVDGVRPVGPRGDGLGDLRDGEVRVLGDPRLPAGQLHRLDLDVGADGVPPAAERAGPGPGVGQAEQLHRRVGTTSGGGEPGHRWPF